MSLPLIYLDLRKNIFEQTDSSLIISLYQFFATHGKMSKRKLWKINFFR